MNIVIPGFAITKAANPRGAWRILLALSPDGLLEKLVNHAGSGVV